MANPALYLKIFVTTDWRSSQRTLDAVFNDAISALYSMTHWTGTCLEAKNVMTQCSDRLNDLRSIHHAVNNLILTPANLTAIMAKQCPLLFTCGADFSRLRKLGKLTEHTPYQPKEDTEVSDQEKEISVSSLPRDARAVQAATVRNLRSAIDRISPSTMFALVQDIGIYPATYETPTDLSALNKIGGILADAGSVDDFVTLTKETVLLVDVAQYDAMLAVEAKERASQRRKVNKGRLTPDADEENAQLEAELDKINTQLDKWTDRKNSSEGEKKERATSTISRLTARKAEIVFQLENRRQIAEKMAENRKMELAASRRNTLEMLDGREVSDVMDLVSRVSQMTGAKMELVSTSFRRYSLGKRGFRVYWITTASRKKELFKSANILRSGNWATSWDLVR